MSHSRDAARLSRTGTPVVNTAQELRDLIWFSANPPEAVQTLGALTAGDGGGGLFRWDLTSVADDNLGTVLLPTDSVVAGRWKREFSGAVNVKWFGAVGDGVIDDTIAIQSTITVSDTVFVPAGNFKITNTLVFQDVNLVGERGHSTITNAGVGTDAIRFSDTSFVHLGSIKDIILVSDPGSGHVITFGFGGWNCLFSGLLLHQKEPSKSCINGIFPGPSGGVYDSIFEDSEYRIMPSATAPAIKILCDGTFFNENEFRNLRLQAQQANGTYLVDMQAQNGQYYLQNNAFNNVNVEQSPSGFIKFAGTNQLTLNCITVWDTLGTITSNLIDCVTATGATTFEAKNTTISNFSRTSGTLDVGVHDVSFGPMQDTILTNFSTSPSLNPSVDVNGRRFILNGLDPGLINTSSTFNYIVNSPVSGIATSDLFAGKNVSDNGSTLGFEFTSSGLAVTATGAVPLKIDRQAGTNIITISQAGTLLGAISYDSHSGKMRLDFQGGLYVRAGNNSPEGSVSAAVGSIYMRTNGSTGTALYVKETGGSGNTGWVAK